MLRATARLSADRQRIEVVFPYSPVALEAVRAVPGRRWSPSKRVWTVPLDLTSGARLREEFGAGLTIEPELRRWGRAERRRLAALRRLSRAKTADLEVVPRVLPELAAKLRPYQLADVYRLARENALNGNEPGTGKTVEGIAAVAEAGLIDKPILTLAPVASIEDTWKAELEASGYPHPILADEGTPQVRKGAINYAWMEAKDGRPVWLVVNPDFLRVKPAPDGTPPGEIAVKDPYSGQAYVANQWADNLLDVEWGAVIIDEFHLFGLTNPRSQFGLAVRLLRAERLWLFSGTPIGGKYKRLWALLNFLHPKEYGSWWTWADRWLAQERGWGDHKVIKDEIQPGREEDFNTSHAHHFLRRTKLADLPGCPAKVHRVVHCGMTKSQDRQYREFEREAEIRIQGQRISGHGILAEWGRLRSFANAACVLRKGKLRATPDSGKLPRLLDVLAEIGVRKSQPEPRARAIVGTMDRSFARIVAAYLREHGVEVGLLVGGVEVAPITRRFRAKNPEPYVIVMTIQKGGTSLNLQDANAAIALDESWNPDDMTQFFDRGDRGSRTTPLLCVTFRTRATIQEYVAEIAGGKAITNKNVLDFAPRVRERASRVRGS